MRALGAEVKALREDVERAKREADKYVRVEQTIREWREVITPIEKSLMSLGIPSQLDAPDVRAKFRAWLELLGARVMVHPSSLVGARVMVHPFSTVKAPATLILHLTRLDVGSELATTEVPPLEVPVGPPNWVPSSPYEGEADDWTPEPLTPDLTIDSRSSRTTIDLSRS